MMLGLLASTTSGQAQRLVAFPGAEGAGKYTSGGRGTAAVTTTVYEVTSLDDTNTPGTLRYALSQSATAAPHRTVVFRVAPSTCSRSCACRPTPRWQAKPRPATEFAWPTAP